MNAVRELVKTVVVVPTYNERDNLPPLVEALLELPVGGLHVVIVDDNSPDGTGRIADELAERSAGRVRVLHRSRPQGLGVAYRVGFSYALSTGADVVIQMDADLSHPTSVIPTMIEALGRDGIGLVIGSRYVPGGATATDWPWRRRQLSVWANRYVNAILRLGVRDATAGFKAWTATTLHEIDFGTTDSSGYSFQVEMNHRTRQLGIGITEVPIVFSERAAGASKMSWRVQLESAAVPWRLRTRRSDQVAVRRYAEAR
ncbi:polyprenol monophosphomannose synthase [Jatrophihabitans sp.]|uniref:polyprenol monophosphomannose synthase n=1 Tax=Jatrophihabitans sp. TaxID=1932789 RepID=UPI0030C6EFC7|nr:putative glycosyltransferase [Jatrophihabitans sp.]